MTAAATACRRHHQQQRAAARAVTALAAPLRAAAGSAAAPRCGAAHQLRFALPHAAATRCRRRRATDRASPFWSAAAAGAQASPTFEDVLLECNNINTLAHILWARVVVPGDTCVDATAGNGFDALALARLALAPPAEGAPPVGGRVLAMDVQALAVDATRARLAAALTPEQLSRCELVHGCHSQLGALLPAASAKLVAFNLGFLPQKNQAQTSKECVTRPDTTALALRAAADALLPGGCLSVMVYSGHPEGPEEAAVVDAFAAALPPRQWTSTSISLMNRAAAPRLVLMYRRHCGVVAPPAAA
jgi:hypothetical protein